MTKLGYTHLLIPKSLHSVLKENAKEHKISIWRYIENLMQTGNFKPGKLVGLGSPREFESPPRRLSPFSQVTDPRIASHNRLVPS